MTDAPQSEPTWVFEEVSSAVPSGSLYVNVDWLDLVERYGEAEAFEVLGKLKDLLG